MDARTKQPQRWAFYRDLDLMDIQIADLTARVTNIIHLRDLGRVNERVAAGLTQKLGQLINESEAKKKQTLQKLDAFNNDEISPQAKHVCDHPNVDPELKRILQEIFDSISINSRHPLQIGIDKTPMRLANSIVRTNVTMLNEHYLQVSMNNSIIRSRQRMNKMSARTNITKNVSAKKKKKSSKSFWKKFVGVGVF